MSFDGFWHFGDIDAHRKKNPWVIRKQVRRTCFGYPGYIDEWIDYSSHPTEEAARVELKRLENFADPMAHESYQITDRRNEIWMVT